MTAATIVRLLYTAVALFGIVGALKLFEIYRADRRFVIASGRNGYRKRYAALRVHEGWRKLLTFAAFVIAGAAALSLPRPVATVIAGACFIGLNGYLAVDTWRALRDELWVRKKLEAEDQTWRKGPPA